MSKSPGHQKMPTHKVEERRIGQRVKVEVGGHEVAHSSDVIRVDEDDYPSRYYFPRSDVKMDMLERSSTTTKCPFKGTASYFNLKLGDRKPRPQGSAGPSSTTSSRRSISSRLRGALDLSRCAAGWACFLRQSLDRCLPTP